MYSFLLSIEKISFARDPHLERPVQVVAAQADYMAELSSERARNRMERPHSPVFDLRATRGSVGVAILSIPYARKLQGPTRGNP